MNSDSTLFDGKVVLLDAMVIISYHGVLALDKLLDWAKGELAVTKIVAQEAKYSQAGPIDIPYLIASKRLMEAPLDTPLQLKLFADYLSNGVRGTFVHEGEVSALVAAITTGCGLACDEKVIRDEFSQKAPGKICVTSWQIATRARDRGFITEQECSDLRKGFFFV